MKLERLCVIDNPEARAAEDGYPNAVLVRELTLAREKLAAAEIAVEHAQALRDDAVAREIALKHELQHRVRNMLATIRSVFMRTIETADTLQDAADHFAGRLDTLARYQSLLVRPTGRHIDLDMILRDELLTLGFDDSDRVSLKGSTVLLPFKVAELMGIAIHELTTNAMKFGALSGQHGRLAVSWMHDVENGLAIEWAETGVPVVASAPLHSGFGREYIEAALPYQLDAKTTFELRPGGLLCRIAISKEWFVTCR